MYCNSEIHDKLMNMGELLCPFCDHQIEKVNKVYEPCCDNHKIENINGMNTCVNCGVVNSYDYVPEYFDFHSNLHKIRKKSILRMC